MINQGSTFNNKYNFNYFILREIFKRSYITIGTWSRYITTMSQFYVKSLNLLNTDTQQQMSFLAIKFVLDNLILVIHYPSLFLKFKFYIKDKLKKSIIFSAWYFQLNHTKTKKIFVLIERMPVLHFWF